MRRELRFAPTVDLGLYVEAHPAHWLTLRFGWNLIWMGRVAMADHSIRFNEVTVDPEEEITVRLPRSIPIRVVEGTGGRYGVRATMSRSRRASSSP
jgi:hypothetical protein